MVSTFINEIHYDNDGTDVGEAIEIAGLAGTDLTGWSLVLYNGTGGAVYNTQLLSGIIPHQQNGFGTVTVTYPSNGIQKNETVRLNLNDTDAYNLGASSSATVTITDNDTAPAIRIRDIQAASHTSPLRTQTVTDVAGLVTAVRSNGFYIQDPNPDNNEATSEAIFVFRGSSGTKPNVGDSILVTGRVDEFRPSNRPNDLTVTQINATVSGSSFSVLSTGNALPEAIVIGAGGRIPPNQIIDNDSLSTFDPAQDGIDFYESLEGMRVQINDAVAVSPTNDFGEIAVLADNGANAGSRTARGGIFVQPDDFNPERILIDDEIISDEPQVNVGAQFNGAITGVMDYSFSNFKVLNTAPLPTATGGVTREVTNLTGSADRLTIATFNVENLDPKLEDINKVSGNTEAQRQSNVDDDIGTGKFAALANLIVNNLQSPDIISLEEVQDNTGAEINDGVVDASLTYQTLIAAIQAAGGPTYEYRDIPPQQGQDGGQPGGNIRVGFLFNPNRVDFVDRPGGTATTDTTVSSSPFGVELSASPGRIDPTDPAFNNSRKPLVGEFLFNGNQVFVIGNHFNSKGGDQPLFGSNQPPELTTEAQRLQQAQAVNDFVDSILAVNSNANIVVAGDLNDFQFSNPLETLEGGVLNNLIEDLPLNEQYTYNFEGNAQALDHILVSNNLKNNAAAQVDVVHVNSEFADQQSDHDPLVSRYNLAVQNGVIWGTNGVDTQNGTAGNDTIYGRGGNDRIFASEGVNTVFGGAGDDLIYGGSRADAIDGGIGNDTIYGSQGNNTLRGGDGNDSIYSGSGSDRIDAGAGNDTLWLSGGQDIVVLARGNGVDTINNFQDGQTRLGLSGGLMFADLAIAQGNGATLISVGNQLLASLSWVQASSITSSDFTTVYRVGSVEGG